MITKQKIKDTLKSIWGELEWVFYYRPKDKYYDIKWYFKNLKTFQKIIKEWRPWDYEYQINLFTFGIEQLRDSVKNGHEEDISRNKKVAAMDELITQLKRNTEDEAYTSVFGENWIENFDNLSDKRTTKNYKKLSKLQSKLRKDKLEKIYRLIYGQDDDKLSKQVDAEIKKIQTDANLTEKEKNKLAQEGYYKTWVNLFDGSGIEGWWD